MDSGQASASPGPSVSMISLGCPRTLVDSELHLGRLVQQGYRVVESAEGADVVIINTCAFIQDSIRESIDTVLKALELKRRGRVKAVIVAGCLVQRFKDGLIAELPEADGFVGVDGFDDIDRVVARALAGRPAASLRRRPQTLRWQEPLTREALTPPHYAYLKISEGCLKGCSFCVIPKIKGPLISRPIEALVDEAKGLVERRGVKELIVVGQDTSDYGVDRYGRPRIAELLSELARIRGLRWIRLLYCHPAGITEELIETMRGEPAICPYLDTAIEHADDGMLRAMNRPITQAGLRERLRALRAGIPGLTLRTSVIVGFPGETDEAFEGLLGFLREIRFERLGAFRYSREEGSASFRLPDQVPEAAAESRLARLMEQQQVIAAELNAALVGTVCEVLIDEPCPGEPGLYLGRTQADCPEVDGQVFVRSAGALSPGAFVPVEITDSYEYDLVGTALDAALTLQPRGA